MLKQYNSTAVYLKREEIQESEEFQFFLQPIFRNVFEQTDSEYLENFIELETWKAPNYIRDGFQYTFGGYDLENRPIWMGTVKGCPIRKVLARYEEELLEKHTFQCAHWIAKRMFILNVEIISIVAKSLEENPSRKGVFLLDAEGLSISEFMHSRTLPVMYKYARKYKDIYNEFLGLGIIINVNKVGLWILSLLRPILYKTFQRLEIYGKDENEWGPRLREIFDSDVIPSFEGNYHHFPQIILSASNREM